MDAVASSLSGSDNVASQATAAAGAVDQLGQSAAAVPPQIQAISTESSALPALFGQIAVAAAGAFTVQQVISFGVGVIETASHIGDMSAKLGVSAEALQRFGYAAEQSGASIDTIEVAISAMNKKLAEGSDSTIEALNTAGLNSKTYATWRPKMPLRRSRTP